MAYAEPGALNVFIPSHAATAALVTGYSRNVNDFAINRYMSIMPVSKPIGRYIALSPNENGRIQFSDIRDYTWAYGDPAPTGKENLPTFTFASYQTQRYNYSMSFARETASNAEWDVLANFSATNAQKAMTARTQLAYTALSGGLTGTATATATVAGGGKWDVGTSLLPYIQQSIQYAMVQINKRTVGKIFRPQDMVLVVPPALAIKMAASPELHDYIKGSPYAEAGIRGDRASLNGMWGLPDVLYGTRLVVENTIVNTSKKGSLDPVLSEIFASTEAYLVTRPEGGFVSAEGSPAVSSLTGFFFEEMSLEAKDDVDNRVVTTRVVEDFKIALIEGGSLSAFKISACV